jgi:hypothetical protein
MAFGGVFMFVILHVEFCVVWLGLHYLFGGHQLRRKRFNLDKSDNLKMANQN